MIIHTVKQGETLYSIGRQYGVSAALLAQNNGITGNLVVGEDLVIQFPAQTHTVRLGDTVLQIARQYGISVRRLFQNNYFLLGQNTLYPGQTIVIAYEDVPTRPLLSNGYAYPFIKEEILRAAAPFVTYVAPFTYGLTFGGNLLNLQDTNIIRIAAEYETKAAMHISTLNENEGFDSALATNIFNNAAAQNTLLADIKTVAREKGYSAIDVDFEYINGSDAQNYADFVARLRSLGYPTIVAAAPKTSADQQGQLYEGHNYKLLGEAADYLFVMTYEWGYTYGPPLAVAPLPNVRRVLEYATTEVSADKIMMGIPNYGYDWTLPFVQGSSRAVSVGNRRAVEIARQNKAEILYDSRAQAPYFQYKDASGAIHEVWFENARSILAKFNLLNELGLVGVGYWNLMRAFPQLWLIQNAMFYDFQN